MPVTAAAAPVAATLTPQEALRELERFGTAQNRKVYARHGVGAEMYGVSYATLNKFRKRIKTDHKLAAALWASGNHDARILATMIADAERVTVAELNAWAKNLDNYVLTDAFSGMVARSRFARKKMEQWTKSANEWTGRTGWLVLAALAQTDPDLPNSYFEAYVETIEAEIHGRKNRVRDAMNTALIAIGLRNKALERRAVAAAKRIGTVEVDHGETSCTTPDAVDYIKRAASRSKKKS